MITKVIEQTVVAGSHIESQVRVRAPNKWVADERATNRSILHAGFSPTVLAREGVYVETDVRKLDGFGLGGVWMVETKLYGVV